MYLKPTVCCSCVFAQSNFVYELSQAVQYYVELLEHTDQKVRAGACIALGNLQVGFGFLSLFREYV